MTFFTAVATVLALVTGAAGPTASARAGAEPVAVGWADRWVAATETVTDSRGAVWSPDAKVAQGGVLRTTTATVSRTASPALYRHERLGVARYVLPVPAPGTYAVVLHTANTDGQLPGRRVFDVSAPGAPTVRVDTARSVGGGTRQHVLLLARASGKSVTVAFRPIAGQPVVSAVSVSLARTGTGALTPALAAEFAGRSGAPVGAGWTAETGSGGWGNNELQTYTAGTANASLDGRGSLAITARRSGSGEYTSARLNSVYRGLYGRVEARIKLPSGAGLLPAFWMLGDDISRLGWPASGEIDIVEALGAAQPTTVFGTVHGPDADGAHWQSGHWFDLGTPVSAAYHRYAVDWWPGIVQISIDGTPYATFTPADLAPSARWVFDKPYYLLLNLAVGGNWPGTPPATTTFPQTMLVDYVRWTR